MGYNKKTKVWTREKMPKDPVEALNIVNEWALAMKDWGIKVSEATGHWEKTLSGTKEEQQAHPAQQQQQKVAAMGATHVVGHPPDPPFE